MGDNKPHYINPLLGFITEHLQSAFFKKGSTTEFYEILEVPANASLETIRSSYRRKALQYHPDKIRQRLRRDPTDEEKEMDLKIKEVYKVLSDPRKRRLYNRLGSDGYRYAENPSELMQSEDGAKTVIENFQRNNADKILALSMIFGIIFASILQPILICLKIDGDLNATWAEVLIPLFVFDFFLIVDGFGGLCMPNPTEVDDDGNLPEQITLSDRLKASCQLVIYILFIAFQALLVQKMDGDADSLNWNVVFLPWYLWEAARITWLVQETCFTTIERPALMVAESGSPGADEEEAGEAGGAGINNEINMQKLVQYYNLLGQQQLGNWTVVVCFLRLWFALFLAAKLGGNVDWNWGLVMLPVWIFLLLEGCFACYFKINGDVMMDGIDPETLQFNPNIEDHAKMMYGHSMNGACLQMCSGGCNYTLMGVLLVCALQVTTISSFLIVLPLWFLAWAVLLVVFCFFCCLGAADTSAMDEMDEHGHLRTGEGGAYEPPTAAFATATATTTADVNGGKEGAEIPVVLATAVATDGADAAKQQPPSPAEAAPSPPPAPTAEQERGSTGMGDKNPLIASSGGAAGVGGLDKDTNCDEID